LDKGDSAQDEMLCMPVNEKDMIAETIKGKKKGRLALWIAFG
jgi:hypothetical protein